MANPWTISKNTSPSWLKSIPSTSPTSSTTPASMTRPRRSWSIWSETDLLPRKAETKRANTSPNLSYRRRSSTPTSKEPNRKTKSSHNSSLSWETPTRPSTPSIWLSNQPLPILTAQAAGRTSISKTYWPEGMVATIWIWEIWEWIKAWWVNKDKASRVITAVTNRIWTCRCYRWRLKCSNSSLRTNKSRLL